MKMFDLGCDRFLVLMEHYCRTIVLFIVLL